MNERAYIRFIRRFTSVVVITASACLAVCQSSADEQPSLTQQIAKIATGTPGRFGVYAKNLRTGEELQFNSERPWYIASMVKVPVAIAVLQSVEAGRLSLEQRLTLKEEHYVDGDGELLYRDPGTTFSIAELLAHSIENSDSTATDMLIRAVGERDVNRMIRETMVEDGFRPITEILQVRYDAYGELHKNADQLTNMDYVEIRSAGEFDARVQAFRRKLGLKSTELAFTDLKAAFDQYYRRGLNSATLSALGILLERLVTGQLLKPGHTERLLGHMQNISTGGHRLQAGLPENTPFAQKTGTQIHRACNMGVTYPQRPERATVMVVCAENFEELEQAEAAFAELARVISGSAVYGRSAGRGE